MALTRTLTSGVTGGGDRGEEKQHNSSIVAPYLDEEGIIDIFMSYSMK